MLCRLTILIIPIITAIIKGEKIILEIPFDEVFLRSLITESKGQNLYHIAEVIREKNADNIKTHYQEANEITTGVIR